MALLIRGLRKNMTEQDARIVINRKLVKAGWKLEGSDRNVLTEQHCGAGFSDYLLSGRNGQNLAVMEAKDDNQGDVYLAKEQARGHAITMGMHRSYQSCYRHLTRR